MLPLSDFQTDISLSVGTLPEPVLENAIMGAAIEFCERTRAWVEDLNPLTIVGGVPDYELDFDDVTMVLIGLTDVFINGRQCHPENLQNIRRTSSDWISRVQDQPGFYYMQSPTVIRFFPGFSEAATGLITSSGSFKPHRKSRELPDFLYNDYYDAIAAGAEARLFSMKGRSWYAPQDAQVSKNRFNAMVDEAKLRAMKSRTRSGYRQRIIGAA